jgi:hypothetical protein
MFSVDPNITDFKVKEKSLLRVLFSMNTHQVATPEMSLEDARSYVIFCQEEGGKISAYIGLHLLDTNRRFFYPHSSNPFAASFINDVDDEARSFAEGLGAVLDEIDIAKMSLVEKDRWLDDQAIFFPKKQADAVQEEASVSPVKAVEEDQESETQHAPIEPVPQLPSTVQSQETVTQAAPVTDEPNYEDSGHPVQSVEQPITPNEPTPSSPQAARLVSAKMREDIIQLAIKAGLVKAPKTQRMREGRNEGGIVSRDKEALARLLSSF